MQRHRSVTVVNREAVKAVVPETEQEILEQTRQRLLTLIWELTQAIIAIMITAAVIYLAIVGRKDETITNAFFAIVAMYFLKQNMNGNGKNGKH